MNASKLLAIGALANEAVRLSDSLASLDALMDATCEANDEDGDRDSHTSTLVEVADAVVTCMEAVSVLRARIEELRDEAGAVGWREENAHG